MYDGLIFLSPEKFEPSFGFDLFTKWEGEKSL